MCLFDPCIGSPEERFLDVPFAASDLGAPYSNKLHVDRSMPDICSHETQDRTKRPHFCKRLPRAARGPWGVQAGDSAPRPRTRPSPVPSIKESILDNDAIGESSAGCGFGARVLVGACWCWIAPCMLGFEGMPFLHMAGMKP